MIIALDYDNTYTLDKPMWSQFVLMAKRQGHSVTFVTYRKEARPEGNSDIEDDADGLDIPVVFTNRMQKEDVFDADVWIDDCPELIPAQGIKALLRHRKANRPRRTKRAIRS